MGTTQQLSNLKQQLETPARFVCLVFLVIVPVVLLFLPKDYFDYGHSICIYTLITGHECFGCGITRAVMHMIHFDFSAAWNFNKLSFFVVPILGVWYLEIIVRNAFFLGIIKNEKIIQLFDKLYPKKKVARGSKVT